MKALLGLWFDERGFSLVFFAIALPALVGLVGLALDVTRLWILDSQLAHVADAAALAAASQLNRSDGSIRRARAAADALANTASFAEGAESSVRLTFRFAAALSDLRHSSSYTLPDGAGAEAVYVEVTTAQKTAVASFVQLVGAQPRQIGRSAIAESQYYACDVTPTIICHRDPERFAASATRGRQYMLRNTGRADEGSILTLNLPGDPNGKRTPGLLASDSPSFCLIDNLLLRRGLPQERFDEALNIRFDRYASEAGPVEPDLARYPPSPNIVQGHRYNNCASPLNAASINPPYHLPRDSAFRSVNVSTRYDQGVGDWKQTLAYGGSGFPNANLAIDEYIEWNHADKSATFQQALRTARSRYEVYLLELGQTEATDGAPIAIGPNAGNRPATMPTGGPRVGPLGSLGENPAPVCYTGSIRASVARRRIIYAAVVDCDRFAENATAAKLSRNVAKLFLTEPSNRGTVLVEFLNMVRPGSDDGKLRHVVQLVSSD